MLSRNASIYIAAQFGSRFANSFLTTAVRYELLEVGGVAKFASATLASQFARALMQQVSGLLSANYPLKRLYVLGEASNLLLVLALVPVLYGGTSALMVVNVGLGLTQAFTQPVAKSMPPAVVSPDHLAVVNSWNLTSDKVGRNLAPLAFTLMSSICGFGAAIWFSMSLVVLLVVMKQTLEVEDQPRRRDNTGCQQLATPALKKAASVPEQLWQGLASLSSDRTMSLLILNTLVTNMLLYPVASLVFPVIFKAMPDGAIEQEGSLVSQLILWMQAAAGIQKQKAWMNYAAVVSLGGVIGPFASSVAVCWAEGTVNSRQEHKEGEEAPSNSGIMGKLVQGQLIILLLFVGALHVLPLFSAGTCVFMLFLIWSFVCAVNNMTTIYFNAHAQRLLGRDERGRFIANILTIFTLADTLGSVLYSRALASGDPAAQISSSASILLAAVVLRVIILVALRAEGSEPRAPAPRGMNTICIVKAE